MNDMRKRFFGVAATSLFTMVLLPLIVLGLAVGAVNNHVLRREIDQSDARQIRFVSERVSGVTGDLEKLNQSLSTNPAVTLRLKSAMQHAARGGIQESEYAVYNAVLDLIYASSYRNKYVDSIYLYFEDGERYFISSKKRLTNLTNTRIPSGMRIIFRQIRLWAHGLPCGRSIRRMAKADAF